MAEKTKKPARPEVTYRVVRFEAENIKKLKAVAIEPNGRVIEITGENGQGKTSILDSLWWALSGTGDIQANPIRTGEETAHITLDLGSLTVTRYFARDDDNVKGYTTSLKVETDEGFKGSQQTLNALIGEIAFDPLAFTDMKPSDQFELLKKFIPDFDFDEAEGNRKKLFDERTDVNRRLKDIQGQIKGITYPDDTPEQAIDETAIVDELTQVGEFNADINERKAGRAKLMERAEQADGRAEAIDVELNELQQRIDALRLQATELRAGAKADRDRVATAPELPEPKDTSEVRARLDEAKAINANVGRRLEVKRLSDLAEATSASSDELTNKIQEIDDAKAKAVAEADLPVKGIGFGAGFITLHGLPFDQASHAEQLRTSMAIVMANKPRLRIVRILEGALASKESMDIINELAVEYDCQVWMETVAWTKDQARKTAFVIEDGMVLREPEEAE